VKDLPTLKTLAFFNSLSGTEDIKILWNDQNLVECSICICAGQNLWDHF